MAKQTINIGTGPNTNSGEALRSAFNKINLNFTELYARPSFDGNWNNLSNRPNIPTDVSQLTDITGVLGESGSSSTLVNGEVTLSLDEAGVLTLPSGGLIGETVVTENPTIVIQPASPDHETQALFIKGGVPGFINIENGIEIQTYNQTAAVNDLITYYVYSEPNANATMYWWVDGTDETSGNTRFNPDNGTVTLDEYGGGTIEFEVLDTSQPFRIFVSDTLYNAYANNNGAVSTYYNEGVFVDTSYHLHLTTGDLQETSIFLGTDNHNVRTRSDGAIVLTSYDYNSEQTYTLTLKNNELRIDSTDFPNDEDLYVKAGDDLYLDAMDDDIHIRSNDDTRIRTGYNFSDDTYTYEYRFDADGELIISDYNNGTHGVMYPHMGEAGLGLTIESSNELLLKSAYGNNTWVLGTDGVLTVPNSINFEGSGRINNSVSDGGGLQIEGLGDFEIKVTQGEGQETAIFGFNSTGIVELPADGGITFPDATTQTTAWTGSVDWDDVTNTPAIPADVSDLTDTEGLLTVTSVDIGAITFDDNTVQANPLDTVGTKITVNANYLGQTTQNSNVFALSKTADTDQVQVGWIIRGSGQAITNKVDSGGYWSFFVAGGVSTSYPITIESADYRAGAAPQLTLSVAPDDVAATSWTFDADGSITFPDETVQTTAWTGVASAGTTSTTSANVGYIGMPQNLKATSYTLVAGDQGKHIYVTAASQTITVPANATTAFPVGTTIAIIAGPTANPVTIAIASDTMYLGGVGSTGNRTLAAYGMATLVKVAETVWFINGSGLS